MIKNGRRLYHRISCYSTSKYQLPNKLLSNSLYSLGIFKQNSIINHYKQIKTCYVLKSVLIENSSWITFYLKNHSRSKTDFFQKMAACLFQSKVKLSRPFLIVRFWLFSAVRDSRYSTHNDHSEVALLSLRILSH